MKLDESRFRIDPKARAHLALLPRPEVLKALADHVLDICRSGASPREVVLLVNKMLCHVERPGEAAVPYRTVSRSGIANPKNMWLYRARRGPISEGLSGCWAPPKPLARANRLNRAGEQVLYASTSPVTASREVGALTGIRESYSMIVYELVQEVALSRIGSPPFPPALDAKTLGRLESALEAADRGTQGTERPSEDDLEKVKILSGFLNETFSGPEAWYPVSQHLCRWFFPLPYGFDGWLYPSVEKGWEDQNVCLLDQHARSKLVVLEVLTLDTRPNRPPRVKMARRPEGEELVEADESKTAQRVLTGGDGWGLWNKAGVDYVEPDEIQWPQSGFST